VLTSACDGPGVATVTTALPFANGLPDVLLMLAFLPFDCCIGGEVGIWSLVIMFFRTCCLAASQSGVDGFAETRFSISLVADEKDGILKEELRFPSNLLDVVCCARSSIVPGPDSFVSRSVCTDLSSDTVTCGIIVALASSAWDMASEF